MSFVSCFFNFNVDILPIKRFKLNFDVSRMWGLYFILTDLTVLVTGGIRMGRQNVRGGGGGGGGGGGKVSLYSSQVVYQLNPYL